MKRRTRPLTELVAYLDAQLSDLRQELARTQADLEEYRQADAFGWETVHARRAARASAAVARIVERPALALAAANGTDGHPF